MSISLKCQYGLRAMYELAAREKAGLVRLTDIADSQNIPARFLENILNQLRQGGFTDSRRGKDGGFILAKAARDIRVGEIIRFFEGTIHPIGVTSDLLDKSGDYYPGDHIFSRLWDDAATALTSVYDRYTLRDLLDEEEKNRSDAEITYSI